MWRLIRQGTRIHLTDYRKSEVVDVGNNIVVKYGVDVYRTEMKAVQLVALKTSVRVPQIISFMSDAPFGFLVQEKLPGTSLHQVLMHSPLLFHDDVCDDLGSQLKTIVNHLSPLDDPRGFGQVDDDGGYQHTFHRHVFSRFTVPKCEVKATGELIRWMAVQSLEKEEQIQEWLPAFDFSRPSIFSHGDLHSTSKHNGRTECRRPFDDNRDYRLGGCWMVLIFGTTSLPDSMTTGMVRLRKRSLLFPQESTAFYEMYGCAEIYAI